MKPINKRSTFHPLRNKINMYLMDTPAGKIPVVYGFQELNRDTVLYHAYNNGSSVFWIVRPKDCEKLKHAGYKITSINVPAGKYPISYNWCGKIVLESRNLH